MFVKNVVGSNAFFQLKKTEMKGLTTELKEKLTLKTA
jgi:hypothetical protein